jgi:hypothetical protein
MFLHITVEVTSHSFTVTPRRALKTQHLTGSCKLQHIIIQPPSPNTAEKRLRMHQIMKIWRGIWISISKTKTCLLTTSFPGSSLLLRKDPGWGWSRVTRKFDRPRGSRQSIKLHVSTFALYTSIARSECFVPINFEIIYTCQIWFAFAFKL